MRSLNLLGVLALASLSLGGICTSACVVTPSEPPSPSSDEIRPPPSDTPSSPTVASSDAGTPSALEFVPTNLAGLDLSDHGDLGDIVETYGISPSGFGDRGSRTASLTQEDGRTLKVVIVRSLRIPAGSVVRLLDKDPIVVVALETIDIEGVLRADPGDCGGFSGGSSDGDGFGPGGGLLSSRGSGSFCGRGGIVGGRVGAFGATYGAPELHPLIGGSGGSGAYSDADGGGAVQLVAGQRIRVTPGGGINMPGGSFLTAGSGGAILLEAKDVIIGGTLAANGGGGGGSATSSRRGQLSDTPTPGGGSLDGTGGAGTQIDGQNGTVLDTKVGSGGGGAGRIRINTLSGQATITGVVSPALTTPCATMGTLTKK